MKHFKTLTLAALLALFAGDSFAQSHTTPCYFSTAGGKKINVDSGCTLEVKSGGVLQLDSGATETNSATKTSGGSTDVSGIVFSTALTGNPMTQMSVQDIPVASVNANYPALASVSGKKIYLNDFMIYASGSVASATSIKIACSDGTAIATIPVALLTNGAPVGPFTSTGITLGTALVKGCPASTALMVSTVGSAATTTTDFFVNLPYTVQ